MFFSFFNALQCHCAMRCGFDKDTISRLGSGTKQKPLCGFVKTKTLK
tara:strand:+ start:369 stop:509 length:141 start_codon:yes stop_codon:yes gene_type:complete